VIVDGIITYDDNTEQTDFRTHELPLARIKKIMKSEEEGDPQAPRFVSIHVQASGER